MKLKDYEKQVEVILTNMFPLMKKEDMETFITLNTYWALRLMGKRRPVFNNYKIK